MAQRRQVTGTWPACTQRRRPAPWIGGCVIALASQGSPRGLISSPCSSSATRCRTNVTVGLPAMGRPGKHWAQQGPGSWDTKRHRLPARAVHGTRGAGQAWAPPLRPLLTTAAGYTRRSRSAMPWDCQRQLQFAAHRDGHGAKSATSTRSTRGSGVFEDPRHLVRPQGLRATLPRPSKYNVDVPTRSGRPGQRPGYITPPDLHPVYTSAPPLHRGALGAQWR